MFWAVPLLLVGCASSGHGLPDGALGPYPVVRVVDGDTLRVIRDHRTVTLRLIGIGTPETMDPRRPVECFGREASQHARELLAGRRVYLELDRSQGERDRYGRTLAYVWLRGRRTTLVNERMIDDGYAFEYTYRLPYRYQRRFRAAEADARRHSRGLWSPATCDGDPDRPAR
jgi:micrococcal nuclease